MNDFQCWRNATDKHSQRHISSHLINFNTPLAGITAHRVDVYDSVIPLWTFLSIILESYPESSVSVSLRIRRSFMKTPKVYVTLFWKGRQINAWLWSAISKDHIMTSHPRKKLWYFVCLFVLQALVPITLGTFSHLQGMTEWQLWEWGWGRHLEVLKGISSRM